MSSDPTSPPPPSRAPSSAPSSAPLSAPSSAPPGASVRYDVADGVATIRLARPDAMNSLDIATKERLLEAVTRAADDITVRCVVLTGTGRAFCVGQDLKEHLALLDAGPEDAAGPASADDALGSTVERHYNPIAHTLAAMPKPVIAAVNGVAAGAGASLAFACDLRILAEGAGFNLAFAGIALSCDTGSSWTLQRLVGPARALELLYLPRTVAAQEALALGLATRVVPAEEFESTVAELARTLAQGPTLAYASIRHSVAYAATHSLQESLAVEAEMMRRTGATEDHRAAVDAFLAKEKPEFRGR